MDGKYNEYLMLNYNSLSIFSKFPDFVYSWLEKYTIDE